MHVAGLGKLLAHVPPKLRPVAIGAVIGLPIGLYLLLKKKPAAAATTGATGTQTFTSNGVAIPAGGPALIHTRWLDKVTKVYVPTTARGKGWGNWNRLHGEIHTLTQAMGHENRWLSWYRRRPKANASRIAQLEKRLTFQRGSLNGLHTQARQAYKQAKKG
jgi:hypothetical protein